MIKYSSSICVLRLSALGDCINAFGMMGALKKKHPELSILWILDKRFSSLFRNSKGEDLIPLMPVDFSNGILKAIKDLKTNLSGRSFDALLNMQTSLKSSLCSLAVKADLKYGYDSQRSREGQCFFVNRKVPSPENPHVLAGFMAFAEHMGFKLQEPYWDFKLSEEELAPYENISKEKKLFVISPASAKTQKNWTSEGYAALADHAFSRGFQTVLVGSTSPKEQELCNKIMQISRAHCTNLCGKTSLRALAALISKADVVLSPDSAAMHLASALKVPVIGLFAVHDPKRVGSWTFPSLQVSVYNALAQKECREKSIPWRYRVKDEKAMENITVNAVISQFDKASEMKSSSLLKYS